MASELSAESRSPSPLRKTLNLAEWRRQRQEKYSEIHKGMEGCEADKSQSNHSSHEQQSSNSLARHTSEYQKSETRTNQQELEKKHERLSAEKSKGRSSSKSRSRSRSSSRSDSRSRSRSRSRGSRSRSRSRSRTRSRSRSRSRSRHKSFRSKHYHDRRRSDPKDIEETNRLHVGDLDVKTTKRDLERVFGKFGPLKDVFLSVTSPIFAFIVYRYDDDAEEALKKTDGVEVHQKKIRVTYALPRTAGKNIKKPDPNIGCYTCGKRGHFARDCFFAQKPGRGAPHRRGRYHHHRNSSF